MYVVATEPASHWLQAVLQGIGYVKSVSSRADKNQLFSDPILRTVAVCGLQKEQFSELVILCIRH